MRVGWGGWTSLLGLDEGWWGGWTSLLGLDEGWVGRVDFTIRPR